MCVGVFVQFSLKLMFLFIGLLLEWHWIIRYFTLAPGTHSTLQPQLAANSGPISYNCIVSISDRAAVGAEDSGAPGTQPAAIVGVRVPGFHLDVAASTSFRT